MMKKLSLVLLLTFLTGCTTIQGSDGHTYYWVKPIPFNTNTSPVDSPSVKVYQGTVNGRSYQATVFK